MDTKELTTDNLAAELLKCKNQPLSFRVDIASSNEEEDNRVFAAYEGINDYDPCTGEVVILLCVVD